MYLTENLGKMKITDIAYMTGTSLELKFSTTTGLWYAGFPQLEISRNSFLVSCMGDHENTTSKALKSLADAVRKQVLVKYTTVEEKRVRVEYEIPDEEIII